MALLTPWAGKIKIRFLASRLKNMKIKTKNIKLAFFIANVYTKMFHRDSKISNNWKSLRTPDEILNNWYFTIELK